MASADIIGKWCVSNYTSVRKATQYYLDGPIGSGGYDLDNYLVQVLVNLAGYWILSGLSAQIRRIAVKYISYRGWSTWYAIEYYLCDTVGLAGYRLNIYSA
jgi:hypothetical protein